MVRKMDHETAASIGSKGGKARKKKLSAKRRKEIARRAIATRWENYRKKK